MKYTFWKRLIDIIISTIGIILSLVITIPTMLCLIIANNGSPFFFQLRPGKNGKLFQIVKFKTMNDKRNKQGNLLPDEIRLTPIGKLVRKLSIDELPQLINVLKGDMSLIGPRPLLIEYLDHYTPEQARRHEVQPGITGWAQVNGRNSIKFSKKIELDIWYVNHISFKLDIQILWLTINNVIKQKGISENTNILLEIDDLGFTKNIPQYSHEKE